MCLYAEIQPQFTPQSHAHKVKTMVGVYVNATSASSYDVPGVNSHIEITATPAPMKQKRP